METITEYWLKIKSLADQGVGEWGLFALIFLIGIASFGLGRLSALQDAHPPVSIGQASREATPRALFIGGLVVASNSGSVYYYPWCAGAQKILQQNQRWFADEATAEQAGFTASKGCKGLGGL